MEKIKRQHKTNGKCTGNNSKTRFWQPVLHLFIFLILFIYLGWTKSVKHNWFPFGPCVTTLLRTIKLKTLNTIGICRRPVFSLGVSQHMHTITNLWKFELNWSSKLRDNNGRKKHPYHTKLCAFRCLISGPQNLILRSQNQIPKF